jgi:hypothetical protein
MARQFLGKYRGRVVENLDPLELGRLQVQAPLVLGTVSSAWALPCVPYAGPGVGWYVLPPIGASVWVEFEGGNPDYPIWSGCFWTEGQVPARPAVPTTRILKTGAGTLAFDDLDGEGGFTLSIGDPAVTVPISIRANSEGLVIAVGETQIALRDLGVTVTSKPGTAEVTPEGVKLSHGSAMISIVEPEVSLNGGALTVI